ncbi:FadR family transcriptional regulator [Pueribacillus theae]|uniref:FadR family transcriptional regulator n=1 Tax=Pueribacillus theae TaxID=2171751 RepID=A0A2U1JHT8_9BACI|nr:FadR/GntR family transcriptional regulator [Pueribacillus theae]PWA04692.1 FadR family transcriptional regulator [Pueribacillus theae]
METFFKSIDNQKVYQKIIQQILNLIENGNLKPGDRLPGERQMTELLGCSRAPLREAFRVLESDGILVSKQGDGRYIQKIHPLTLTARKGQLEQIKQSAVLSFLEAREALEPKIAELAALRATKLQIENLYKVIEDMEKQFENPKGEIVNNQIFHLLLAEASHNSIFVTMIDTNIRVIKSVRENTLVDPGRLKNAVKEHVDILKAVENKNPNLAAKLALDHVLKLKEKILKNNDKLGKD